MVHDIPTAGSPPDATQDTLARLAEMRAGGSAWEVAARRLRTTADGLKALAREHHREYRKLLAAARHEVVIDGFCEGVFTLRRQIRSGDERIAHKAADALVRTRLALLRHRPRKAAKPDPVEAAPELPPELVEAAQLAKFLESLPPEELREKAEHMFQCDLRNRGLRAVPVEDNGYVRNVPRDEPPAANSPEPPPPGTLPTGDRERSRGSNMFRVALGGFLMTAVLMQDASGQVGYQRPPKAVTDILDVPAPPAVSVSPGGEHVLFVEAARYPSIAEVAEPVLKLGGLRINPKTNGPARAARYIGMSLMKLPDGKSRVLDLPPNPKLGAPIWSHDGKRFAVTNATDTGIELWRGDVSDAKLTQVPGVVVNAAIGNAVQWLPGADKLLVQTIPAGRGKPSEAPLAPAGPVVQESSGKAAPVRTFQDLLKDAHDEALFDYYCTSQLVVVGDGVKPFGKPAVFLDADTSPDGRFLLATTVKRPYSYLHPYPSFPRAVEVWDRATGEVVMPVADLPLQDNVPIEGVPTGRRAIRWVPTDPHKLMWVEALDGGDPKAKATHRDVVQSQAVGGAAGEVVKLEHRFAGLDFLPTDNRLLVRDYDRDRKWSRTFLVSTSVLNTGEPQLIFDRSVQDRYGDPGTPITRVLPNGQRVVRTAGDVAGNTIFLAGAGASPQGDRPFLDRFDLTTKKAERVFHSGEKEYAEVAAVLNKDGTKLLIRRESPTAPGNFFYRDANHDRPLTTNADPAPEFRKADKSMVRAKRADGVELTVTLHTPAGWKKGEKLPAVMIAYPTEFASAADAGQVVGSPNRFTTVAGPSHLFFLTQGYAVMEVTMPIVGPPETANDTFIEQLVMNAKAAIDLVSAADRPVDRTRVGVMGHSYGAFMTANLLAHSDLFRAGIARSGAYNRTLTPFGFQNERRTFWEAPAVYSKMSPFDSAHKLKTPLLLIHGAADSNPGTFPVQSERMYAAVRGTGGTARLVLLPHEDHGYAARESIEHVLHEQIAWFDKHVKQATSGKQP